MHRILAFKPHLRVERGRDGRVFLVGERERVLLTGALHARVACLVDGRRTGRQIIETLEGEASPHEVYHALRRLEQEGHVAEAVVREQLMSARRGWRGPRAARGARSPR
jgi:oxazoline/thiazoline synthase